jgi:hypothetical protein
MPTIILKKRFKKRAHPLMNQFSIIPPFHYSIHGAAPKAPKKTIYFPAAVG